MKKIIIISFYLLFLLIFSKHVNAQSVGIGSSTFNPDASSILEIKSDASPFKGLLVPRMTLAQRNSISSPATSLLIFQTDNTPGYYYNSGTPASPVWVRFPGSGSGTLNYIPKWTPDGTTLGNSQIFDNGTKVGINNTSPSAKLDISEAQQSEFYGTDNAFPTANLIIRGTGTSRAFGTGSAIEFVVPANTDGSNPWAQARILATPDNASNGNAEGAMYLQTRANYNPGTGGTWNWRTNMTLRASGNIGIGTTTPSRKLDVLGGIGATDQLYISKNNAAISNLAYNDGHIQLVTTDNTFPRIGFHRAGTDAFALYYAGGYPPQLRYRDAAGNDGLFWHSGNDGSGSTLDADLLDGQHGNYYQTALTNPVTGTGNANQVAYWNGTNTITGNSGFTYSPNTLTINGASSGSDLYVGNPSGRYFRINTSDASGSAQHIYTGNDLYLQPAGGLILQPGYPNAATGNIQIKDGAGNLYATFDGVNQRLGIGTSTPGSALHIGSTGWSANQLHFSSGWGTGGYHATIGSGYSGITAAGIMLGNPHIPWRVNYGAKMRYASDQAASYYWDLGMNGESGGSTDRFDLNRNNVNLLTVTNGGSVGIGTTSPAEAFSVNKAMSAWQGRFSNSSGTGADVYLAHGSGYGMHIRGWNATDNIYTLEMYNNTALTNAFYNSGRVVLGLVGNVGIGTASPNRKLEINNSLKFTNSGSDGNDGVMGTGIFSAGLNMVGIRTDGTYRKVSIWGEITQQQNDGTNVWSGQNKFTALAGTGNRTVYADANGVLKTSSGDNSLWVMSANLASSQDDLGGTVLSADNDDDKTYHVALPSGFTIEGTTYNYLAVCTNGWASFEINSGDVTNNNWTNYSLPSSYFTTPTVFAYWDDLVDYGGGEEVRSQTFGSSPHRTLVINYNMRANNSTVYRVKFQIEIHEGSNLINVKYHSMAPDYCGQSATIGFQLSGGSNAKAFPLTYNGKILDDNASNAEGWSICPLR